jgi:hypothetical protein|eukprot:COSAG06_NODE_557_length_14326_cov_3.507697_4_plen_358_part_00
MSSVASSDEDADYDLTRKHLYLPSGKRIKLKSPRFLASLAANGVVLAELEEPSIDPFYERAAGNWELAEREWTVANTTRREKLDLVVGHRAARIKEASEEKAPKPDGEPLANELLSGASLIALEKEHVSRVLQKRAKKQAFEAAQSELFAARHNETVQSAHKKHSRAQAFRAKVKEEERAHYQEKSQILAQKQQRAKEGFERWEEHKEEQRRQMQRRDEETDARNYGRLREPRRAWRVGVRVHVHVCVCASVCVCLSESQPANSAFCLLVHGTEMHEQRSFELLNRSMEFAARVEVANQRGSAILGARTQQLSDERARFEKRTTDYAKLTSSELNAQRKAQRAAAEARDLKTAEFSR